MTNRSDAQSEIDVSPENSEIERAEKAGDDAYTKSGEQQSELDKQLLTFSSAFLLFSFSFLKDVIPLKEAVAIRILYFGDGAFAVCILAVLLSYWLGAFASRKLWNYWQAKADVLRERGESNGPNSNLRTVVLTARILSFVNLISCTFFLVGIVLLITFIITNLEAARQPKDHQAMAKANDGLTPKIPSGGKRAGLLPKIPTTPATKPAPDQKTGK